jgi:hypothetical protein
MAVLSSCMSDKNILINSARYLYINEAAKTAGLGPDYIARLCRHGAIKGTKVDRAWYVSEQSLKNFLVTHSYQKAIWRENVARVRRIEYQRALLLAEPSAHRNNAITTIAPSELFSPRIFARLEEALAREAHTAAQIVGGGQPLRSLPLWTYCIS